MDRGNEIDGKQQESRPCRRHMIVEDALDVAHGLLGGRNHQSLTRRIAQESCHQASQDWERPFHSACNTDSNRSRQAIVHTTSWVASNTIQKRAESPPVRMAVLAFTMASSAGMEN